MIKHLLASATSGICLAIAFPPWQVDLLVWIALIPLFWSIYDSENIVQAGFSGWVSGFCFFLIDLRWIFDTLTIHGHFSPFLAVPILFFMVALLALGTATFSLCSRFIHNSGIPYWVIFPITWVTMEYARTYLLTGFPWDLLGYSLAERANLIQIVDITGVYGLSFVIVFVNNAILQTFMHKGKPLISITAQLLFGIVLIGGYTVYGWVSINYYDEHLDGENSNTVGILQGAIPQGVKWNNAYRSHTFNTYERLSEDAVSNGASLLIWPETSVPVVIGGEDLSWMAAIEISRKVNAPMLIGAPSQTDSSGEVDYYNSAFLVDGSEILSGYDKMHLVPFGEYMPLAWLFPLGPGMAAREADFTPGATMTLMRSPKSPPFCVLICYEAIFPDLSRIALKNGAKFLVNITNDGWFDMTAAPLQHLSMAKFRSIENRVWLMRSANTGISAAFDPVGRLVNSIPLGQSGWINVKMPEQSDVGSFYTKFGDVFAHSCVIIFLLMFSWALVYKIKFQGVKYDTIRY